ncbi:MAG: hypothetical protein MUF10_00670 [Thermoanaerobaculaceae bacterium]|nr:hypothetical protein [Thermoanaerobaculaceae bacterium]
MLLAAVAAATPPPAPPCDAACERRVAQEQLARGELRPAVERLRGAVARHPDDPVLPLWLARAYLLDGNLFWAERTLHGALDRQGESAVARLWLACVHLRQGDPELAARDLAAAEKPPDGPWVSRKSLAEAFRAHLAADPSTARVALDAVGRRSPVFPEDLPVWSMLQRRLDPWWLDPVSGDMELGIGHTSNALAGSPTDTGATGTSSALADLELRLRLSTPAATAIRPVLELEVLGHGLHEQEYRELSSLQGAARLGGILTGARHRLLLGIRAERLLLDQSPSLYAEALRGEVEVEWSDGWLAFAGGGHRDYRDERRTRQEWDAGVGGPVRLLPGASTVMGATVRGSNAHSPAYDLRGASVAAATRFSLGRGVTARVAVSVSWDDYPHSGGPEGEQVFGTTEQRRDLTGKITLGVWLPPWHGLRAGLEWQLARRDSTADDRQGFNFDYRESRPRVLVRWTFSADPWAPPTTRPPADHVPLAWGLGPGEHGEDERIIDLLRQDEELRRGSSCGV